MSAVRRVRLIVVTGVTVLLAALSVGGSGQLAPAYANGLPVASADVSPAAASTTTVESVIADDGRVVLLLGEAPSSMTSAMGFPMYQYATSGDDGATWSAWQQTSRLPRPATRDPQGGMHGAVAIDGLANGTPYQVMVRWGEYVLGEMVLRGEPTAPFSVTPVAREGSVFVPLATPLRAVDTRVGGGKIASGAAAARVVDLSATQVGATPILPAGAVAAAYNLTAVTPAQPGHFRIMPDDVASVESSSLNFAAGQSIANAAVVKVAPNRKVRIDNRAAAPVDAVLDVVGYFMPVSKATVAQKSAGLFSGLAKPARVYDSGNPGIKAGGEVTFSVRDELNGALGIVPPGATGVAYNATIAAPLGGGNLSIAPAGQPTSSSALNWSVPGDKIANASFVAVSADGRITVRNNSGGTVRIIIDVTGYFSGNGQSFYPLSPTRLFDTRTFCDGAARPSSGPASAGVEPQGGECDGTIRAGTSDQPSRVRKWMRDDLYFTPPTATAAMVNLTATRVTGAGHLRMFPFGQQVPASSILNWTSAGQTRANGTVATVGTYSVPGFGSTPGLVEFAHYSSFYAPMDLVADTYGYFN